MIDFPVAMIYIASFMMRERIVHQNPGPSRGTLQVLLRWNIEHGSCVIPKSGKPERITENADVWGWSLKKEDFDAISSIKYQVLRFAALR